MLNQRVIFFMCAVTMLSTGFIKAFPRLYGQPDYAQKVQTLMSMYDRPSDFVSKKKLQKELQKKVAFYKSLMVIGHKSLRLHLSPEDLDAIGYRYWTEQKAIACRAVQAEALQELQRLEKTLATIPQRKELHALVLAFNREHVAG